MVPTSLRLLLAVAFVSQATSEEIPKSTKCYLPEPGFIWFLHCWLALAIREKAFVLVIPYNEECHVAKGNDSTMVSCLFNAIIPKEPR